MTPTQTNFEYILIRIFIYFEFLLSPKLLVAIKEGARVVFEQPDQ